MKLSIELESDDWMELLCIHKAMMDIAGDNIGHDPLRYSKMARITNEIQSQVIKKIPNSEIDRIVKNKTER